MPVLKPISGHTNAQGIKRYLEKDGRAIARDFFNLSWDERYVDNHDDAAKASVPWADQMDATREAAGNHLPWKGRHARTFKHFVLSPDPEDHIGLDDLRELSCSWALRHFGDFEIAIIYHDDNENRIPHAHIVVNNTNLSNSRRLHTEHPEDLNRELQEMARERGLRGLSNERQDRTGLEELAAKRDGAERHRPVRTKQAVYIGRAEREIMAERGWSWVADIRNRVGIAKTLARSEVEFRELLSLMEVDVSESSSKRNRGDWIFSLAEEPSKKVSGQRLGLSFGREAIVRKFSRAESYRPTEKSCEVLRERAAHAVELSDLLDLDDLAHALDTCSRFNIRCMADFDKRLDGKAALTAQTRLEILNAREYMETNGLLPKSITYARPARPKAGDRPSANAAAAAARRQRQAQQRQIEQQRQKRRER